MAQQSRRNRKTGRQIASNGTNFVSLSGISFMLPAGVSGVAGPTGVSGFSGVSGYTGLSGVSGYSGPTGSYYHPVPNPSFLTKKVEDKYFQFRVAGKLVFLSICGATKVRTISHQGFWPITWTFIFTDGQDYRFYGTSKEEHEEIIQKFSDAYYGQQFIDKL